MLIIGCDYHPGFQQIAFVDTETGEFGERRLTHSLADGSDPPTVLVVGHFRTRKAHR
jgi:hypothetical protein